METLIKKSTMHAKYVAVHELKYPSYYDGDKVSEFLDDWDIWLYQHARARIRCRRHHLRLLLKRHDMTVIVMVLTLVRMGENGNVSGFEKAYRETLDSLSGRNVENVLFEYGCKLKGLAGLGMWLVIKPGQNDVEEAA